MWRRWYGYRRRWPRSRYYGGRYDSIILLLLIVLILVVGICLFGWPIPVVEEIVRPLCTAVHP
jgi:hypothetical protein